MVHLRLLLLRLVLGPAVCRASSQEGKMDMKWERARTNRSLREPARILQDRLEPTLVRPLPQVSNFHVRKSSMNSKHLCQG